MIQKKRRAVIRSDSEDEEGGSGKQKRHEHIRPLTMSDFDDDSDEKITVIKFDELKVKELGTDLIHQVTAIASQYANADKAGSIALRLVQKFGSVKIQTECV